MAKRSKIEFDELTDGYAIHCCDCGEYLETVNKSQRMTHLSVQMVAKKTHGQMTWMKAMSKSSSQLNEEFKRLLRDCPRQSSK